MTRQLPRMSIAIFAASLGFLLSANVGQAKPSGDDDDGDCKPVLGTFTAANLPPSECASPVGFCTEGKLKGNFKGSYSFVMSAVVPADEPDVPAVTFFKGVSTVVTNDGHEYTGIDTGAINLEAPGLLNSGRFSTLLTFTEGGAGHLWIHGTSDLVEGTVKGVYSGLVCPE
jgi:hypothetical protein